MKRMTMIQLICVLSLVGTMNSSTAQEMKIKGDLKVDGKVKNDNGDC